MATIGNTYLSLIDVLKRQGENGEVSAAIIEMLSKINPILQDMITVECNQGTSHLTTIRTGLPTATWTQLYKGVQPTKSTTAQVTDTTGSLEAWSEVDARLIDIAGAGAGALRLSEAAAFLEAMSEEMASTLFYGNQGTDPEEFTGLAPRFNSSTATNGSQIVKAGGTGSDNTSIWMVVWGPNTCHGLYPKGSSAGFRREDLGIETTKDSSGGLYRVYREKFAWDMGFTVRDWRYISRICNIDVSDVQAGSVPLFTYLRKAYYKLRQREVIGGSAAIYCNSTILEALDALATNSGTTDNYTRLSYREIEGGEVLTYRGIPIRQTDAILNTESLVS